jgi:hypothetical protein
LKDLNILICPPSLEYFCFESKFVFREALQLCGGSFLHALNSMNIERHLPGSRASWVCQYQPLPPEHFPSQGKGPNLQHESFHFRFPSRGAMAGLWVPSPNTTDGRWMQQKRTSALISKESWSKKFHILNLA